MTKHRSTDLPKWHLVGCGTRTAITYRPRDSAEITIPLARASRVCFEQCQPARPIPEHKGQTNTPGEYWSATSRHLVRYESWLESKWITLLDFDPAFVAFSCQPFTFHGVDNEGVWTHTPDIFARRADGTVLLLDIKHAELHDADVTRQARRSHRSCAEIGWDYALVDQPDPHLWATVSWLAGFRREPQAGLEFIPHILAVAQRPIEFVALCQSCPPPELSRPVVFHLCWNQQLRQSRRTAPQLTPRLAADQRLPRIWCLRSRGQTKASRQQSAGQSRFPDH
jgi:hypothetical protein